MRFIPGSHRSKSLAPHDLKKDPCLTLSQELSAGTFNESEAVDVALEAGQISLHDVYLFHGSEANTSALPRRGMTLRLMPTTSHYDREIAKEAYRQRGDYDQSIRTLFLMRGVDRSGRNDFQVRGLH